VHTGVIGRQIDNASVNGRLHALILVVPRDVVSLQR
jgi:hypothetical protein